MPRWEPLLAVLALTWLGGTLWAAHRTIGGAPAGSELAAVQTAFTLPTIVLAGLLAGCACGLLGTVRLARRRAGLAGRVWRTSLAGAAGLILALLAAGPIVASLGTRNSAVNVALTVGVGAVLGGLAGALRPAAMTAAGLAGALASLGAGVLRGAFAGQLTGLFGAGETVSSQLTADSRLDMFVSLASGILAGLTAHWYLRHRRAGLGWRSYLAAGGSAGLALLAAEAVVRLAGHDLLARAADASEIDRAALAYLNEGRVNHAMTVFFVGALTSLVVFGRGIRPARDTADASPPAEDPPPVTEAPATPAAPATPVAPAAPGAAEDQEK